MMQAYSRLAIRTCHRRGAPAIGGLIAVLSLIHISEPTRQEATSHPVSCFQKKKKRSYYTI
ncbi:hypothetical protein [Deinococcus sp. ME38]|uniref:hypothetical protein n=1 Tax=Deinococcus sp. ME38 TaxID=3400344 RepID=UPI003B59F925